MRATHDTSARGCYQGFEPKRRGLAGLGLEKRKQPLKMKTKDTTVTMWQKIKTIKKSLLKDATGTGLNTQITLMARQSRAKTDCPVSCASSINSVTECENELLGTIKQKQISV